MADRENVSLPCCNSASPPLLPEWQVPDLAFPFARAAAFCQQQYVINGDSDPNIKAHFEHTGH
jgi:hypothetical protein